MITVFIPAKGHSERVPSKNLRLIQGKTLIQRTLDFSLQINRVSKIILSTDSLDIVSATFSNSNIDLEFMLSKPDTLILVRDKIYIHKRPLVFCEREAKTTSLLLHYLNLDDEKAGHLLLLQPTSPFRKESDLTYLNSLDLSTITSLFSVVKAESPHPNKTFQRKSDGSPILTESSKEQLQSPAQILGKYFAPDGAFYLTHIKEFLESHSLISNESICFERTGFCTINIDTENDLTFAQYVAENSLY